MCCLSTASSLAVSPPTKVGPKAPGSTPAKSMEGTVHEHVGCNCLVLQSVYDTSEHIQTPKPQTHKQHYGHPIEASM
jgi:hypothetical protein